ncbi:MAG: XdhC family protein [Pseudomonadota bacterium]
MQQRNRLFEQYERWREAGHRMVLAVVTATAGSTYSKAGDFMLLAEHGQFQGLLSGGCVEGDLALRAAEVMSGDRVAEVHYALGDDDDALWGMGAGCEGSLTLLLVPLNEHGEFDQVLNAYRRGIPAALAIGWSEDGFALAASVRGGEAAGGPLTALARVALSGRSACCSRIGDQSRYAFVVLPPPRVLILGAGADSVPLLEFGLTLGWRMTSFDHRPAYIEALPIQDIETYTAPAESLAATVALEQFDAVVIMSHHLQTDACYLRQIAARGSWDYVAALGPSHRRLKVLDAAGLTDDALDFVLHGPAGFDVGGREPASIGLSIMAEMHSVLAQAGKLTTPAAPREVSCPEA